jgi:uncharacterized membrane protein YcjF (UPF0283 family)
MCFVILQIGLRLKVTKNEESLNNFKENQVSALSQQLTKEMKNMVVLNDDENNVSRINEENDNSDILNSNYNQNYSQDNEVCIDGRGYSRLEEEENEYVDVSKVEITKKFERIPNVSQINEEDNSDNLNSNYNQNYLQDNEVFIDGLGYSRLEEEENEYVDVSKVEITKKIERIPDETLGHFTSETWDALLTILNVFNKTLIPLFVLAAITIGGCIGLYIYFEIVSFMTTLASYPVWLKYFMLFILVILLAVTLTALTKLFYNFYKLKPVNQSRISDIDRILNHRELIKAGKQWKEANKKREGICKLLLEYVNNYQLGIFVVKEENNEKDSNAPIKFIIKREADKNALENLKDLHKKLKDGYDATKNYVNREEWLVGFKNFQESLDKIAENRLDECAKWVGFKTAVSPYPVLDMLITAYWSFTLISDLCTIYNVRLGKFGMFLLLCQTAAIIFISGKVDQAEDCTTQAIEGLLGNFLNNKTVTWIAGNITAKTASGLINYYLIRRLGKFIISELQPLQK